MCARTLPVSRPDKLHLVPKSVKALDRLRDQATRWTAEEKQAVMDWVEQKRSGRWVFVRLMGHYVPIHTNREHSRRGLTPTEIASVLCEQ